LLALKQNPDDIAALIIEPIQGEGGDNHFRAEFLHELRKLADDHEFLLIFDEVQTGFATTGKWWSFEHFGVLPDIFCFGKKTQICGIAASKRIDDVDNVFKISSRINSTWGGSIVDMVRCTKIIEIIEADHLLEHTTKVGERFLQELLKLEHKFPGQVTNARGRGFFAAITLPSKQVRDNAISRLREHNVLVLSSGVCSVRFRPPLVFSEENAVEAVARLEKVLQGVFG